MNGLSKMRIKALTQIRNKIDREAPIMNSDNYHALYEMVEKIDGMIARIKIQAAINDEGYSRPAEDGCVTTPTPGRQADAIIPDACAEALQKAKQAHTESEGE